MNCSQENTRSLIWAIIVGAIVLLIVYGIISSKLKTYKQRKAREKSLPFVADNFHVDVLYRIQLTDGKVFQPVKLIGTSSAADGQFSLGGWEGMLVLMQSNGKRIFVKQSSVRCVEEI
jgi:hypothetical protein